MKTITILKHEFDEKLAELVNNCDLPACVIKPSVANLLQILEQYETKQYEADLEAAKKEEEEKE